MKEIGKNNYYFTFGFSHSDPNTNEPLAQKYVRITAKDENSAREEMCHRYGDQWSFCYSDEKVFKKDIKKYKLKLHGKIIVM